MGINMKSLYLILFFMLLLGASYFAGIHAGTLRCRAKSVVSLSNNQTKIFEIQGKINAEVVGRSGDDIRRILREKYTIVE